MDLDPQRLIRHLTLGSLGILCLAATLHAGVSGFNSSRSIGGVMIDGAGVVRAATIDEQKELARLVREGLAPAPGELGKAAKLRMVSLKGLQQALAKSTAAGARIPNEMEYLAGLQRVEYVFVDPDQQDIVIAGPAEPWKLREDGSVVGEITGGSTMRLADLMVALQSVESARREGISCSIEPTPEGRRSLQQLLKRVKLRPGQSPVMLEAAMKEAYGPQQILLTGMEANTRFARTMVAADFEMKRVAMGLRESPIAALPSYLQMARNSRHGSAQNPRWWMACDYDSLSRSEDGLSWKLTGQGVKTMTEQDLVATDGSVKGAGATDRVAQQWADTMTDSFADLAREMPIFADLQNLMDMTVVATLIAQEGLAEKAGLNLEVLMGKEAAVELASYSVPKSIDPQCSFIRGRSGWVVTASGGVEINAFEIIEKQEIEPRVADTRAAAITGSDDRWWWNQ